MRGQFCRGDEGRLLLAAADSAARNLEAVLLEALPPAQREPFMKALRAVVRALKPGRSLRP
jgi:hypothetical protein